MKLYKVIVYHELYGPELGAKWTIKADSEEEANEKADRICTKLQHGVKPKKRQGPLVHTKAEEDMPF